MKRLLKSLIAPPLKAFCLPLRLRVKLVSTATQATLGSISAEVRSLGNVIFGPRMRILLTASLFIFLASQEVAHATLSGVTQGLNQVQGTVNQVGGIANQVGGIVNNINSITGGSTGGSGSTGGASGSVPISILPPDGTIPGMSIASGHVHMIHFPQLILYWIQVLLSIAGGCAVVMVMVGGVQYMIGSLSNDKERGKKTVTYALGGLIVAFFAWWLVELIQVWITS